jgi:hypothetical protein
MSDRYTTTFNGKGPFGKTIDPARFAPRDQRAPYPRTSKKSEAIMDEAVKKYARALKRLADR